MRLRTKTGWKILDLLTSSIKPIIQNTDKDVQVELAHCCETLNKKFVLSL